MMKKTVQIMGLLLLLLVAVDASAQKSNKKKKETKKPTEITDITEKLWIGAGIDGIGFGSTAINAGLSPIVGYKITDNFSAGIRLPLDYTYLKLTNDVGEIFNYQKLNVGIGAFSRFKIFRGVFAHAEANRLWNETPVRSSNGSFLLDPNDSEKLLTEKSKESQVNLGLGYSYGRGGLSYEISILYDVLEGPDSPTIPILFRGGVNYNF